MFLISLQGNPILGVILLKTKPLGQLHYIGKELVVTLNPNYAYYIVAESLTCHSVHKC